MASSSKTSGIFSRFTERARQVVVFAQEEARNLHHDHIGSGHLLVGLVREEEGIAAYVLESLDLSADRIRSAIGELVSAGEAAPQGQIPFTPRAKGVLEKALREALGMGHNYIGTEHILLAVANEDEGTAHNVFAAAGIETKEIRRRVIEALQGPRRSRAKARPAPDPAATPSDQEIIEPVPTLQDRPATRDELGRSRLAEVLGERIRRVRGESTEYVVENRSQRRRKLRRDTTAARRMGSFLVHIYAPWGAGKSSLLNFLAIDLRNRRRSPAKARSRSDRLFDFLFRPRRSASPILSQWIVVEFSAWEHQRLVAPWWWLLTAMQRSCSQELWQINRGRWLWFTVRDFWWRIWNARVALLTIFALAACTGAAWALDWFGLTDQSLTAVRTAVLTASAAIALAGTFFGLARGTSKWLALGSAEGAAKYLKRAHDPLGVYRRRFRWLVRASGRPISVFIDDLDRCRPEYVVELLEGIQTLFSAEPVTYVVAADRGWLCESFAKTYSEFEDSVGDPGRPLGFLFLEKTFQISLEIPPMSDADRARYWAGLMDGNRNGSRQDRAPSKQRLAAAFADASTEADLKQGVADLRRAGVDSEQALQAAVRRSNSPGMQEHLENLLSEFAPLLESNPRSMKRLMNAYGIERDRLLRDGYWLSREERRQLVLLTILRLRWPLFAEHLHRTPSDARFCTGPAKAPPGDHRFSSLFRDPEVRKLFDGREVAERLGEESLKAFPGRAPG